MVGGGVISWHEHVSQRAERDPPKPVGGPPTVSRRTGRPCVARLSSTPCTRQSKSVRLAGLATVIP